MKPPSMDVAETSNGGPSRHPTVTPADAFSLPEPCFTITRNVLDRLDREDSTQSGSLTSPPTSSHRPPSPSSCNR